MATSQDYMNQISAMGTLPDYKQSLTQLYENPVIKPLATEAGDLESKYLPTVFNALMNQGTSATDMSPAAKLASIGASLGRLGGQISTNRSIQDFYGNQIDKLANNQTQNWQNRYNQLKDLYSMAFNKEEADKAAARAAAAQAQAAAFPSFEQLFGNQQVAGTSTQTMPESIQKALYYAQNAAKGLNPFTGQPMTQTAAQPVIKGGIAPAQSIGGIASGYFKPKY